MELAPLDKHASEEPVCAIEIVPPDNVDQTRVAMTVESVSLDKLVSTAFVLVLAHHNALELLTELPKLVGGTDAVETVEVAQLDIVARMESVCVILSATSETAVLMVVAVHAVLVLPMLSVTLIQLMHYMEPAIRIATDVVMESAPTLRHPLNSEPLNLIKLTVPKIAVQSLELFLLPSDKRIS